MNLKKTLLSLMSIIFFASVFAQSSLEYQPKLLLKTLKKAGVADVSKIKEMTFSDSATLQASIQGKFFQLPANNSGPYKYLYIGRVNSCRAGSCSNAPNVANNSHTEYFDYYILFDANKTVQDVRVFNYQATHGHEVTAKGWLKQFIGHDGTESLQVNSNVDAISGATISAHAITSDIEMKTKALKKL